MWKKLSSKILLDHPRLKVIEDDIVLPNGHKTQYLKFESLGCAATLIAINDQGKILLQKEYSYPPNKNLFQFPGGFIPKDESVEEGANREFMEEANLKANKLTLLGSYLTNNRRSDSKMYVYLAEELVEEHLDGDVEEKIDSNRLKEKEIDDLIVHGEFENGYSLAAWCLYKIFRNKNK